MGALTVTSVSTFTSCKDYDSDISNLQGQIDKAALSTDVQSLKTQVETAASNASTAATNAKSALDAVDGLDDDLAEIETLAKKNATDVATALSDAADAKKSTQELTESVKAANEAFAETLESHTTAIENLDSTLQKALADWGQSTADYYTAKEIDNKLDSLADAIQQASDDSIASLKTVVNGYKTGINALYTAVTEVTIVTTADDSYSTELKFQSGVITIDDYTFGAKDKDDKNVEHSATPTYDYKKNATFSFPEKVLVRVNPVNAKIDASMIKLIDSKGGDLSDLLEVTSVEKLDEYLTKATSETGLWVVSLKTKDGVKSEDLAAAKVDNKNKLYAIAINNTAAQSEAAADAANRYVVSGYDLTVEADEEGYEGAESLDSVKVWAASKKSAAQTLSYIKSGANEDKSPIYAQNGEEIVVSFENLPNVDRFYIVRDDAHAGDGEESQTSEINAWNSYSYKGDLNKVVEVKNGYGKGRLNVTIDGKTGDEVQFRIFAVNYDGTLVENTGRSFRVYVGAKTTTATVIAQLVGTAQPGTMTTGWVAVDGTLTDDADILNQHTVDMLIDGKTITANVAYAKNADGTGTPAKGSEVKYIKLTVSDHITDWANGESAVGTIEDGNSPVVNSIGVSLTKILPTADTAKGLVKYTWKDNQKVDGVYTAYLYPDADATWGTNTTYGIKDMNMAISDLDSNCIIEVENAKKKEAGDKWYFSEPLVANASPWELKVYNSKDANGTYLLDGTPHKSYIKYNFGKINSEKPTEDYIVTIEEYNTVFACPLSETAQTYSWNQWSHYDTATKVTTTKNVNELTYGSTATVENVNLMEYIIGKNAFDNTVFGGKLSTLYPGVTTGKYVQITGKLISDGSGKEDYFKVTGVDGNGITFEMNSEATNPSSDVKSWLVLTMKDTFGHENVYKLPFTVKRAE